MSVPVFWSSIGEEFEEEEYLEHQTLIHRKKCGWTIIPIEKDGSVVSKEMGVFRSFDARGGRGNWDSLAKTIQNKRGAPSYTETKEAYNG